MEESVTEGEDGTTGVDGISDGEGTLGAEETSGVPALMGEFKLWELIFCHQDFCFVVLLELA